MSATLVSPPPHDQSNVLSTGPIDSNPRLLHGESAFLTGGPGGRSVLPPPLTHAGSPLARSSSPRHHASTNQSLPSAALRQNSTLNASHSTMSAFWPDDTVTGNHVNSLPNPFDHYLTPLVDTDLDPANFPLSPPRRSSRTTTNDFNAAASRPLQTRNMPLPGPSRSETQLTGISLDDSLDTQFTDDLFGDEALPHSSQTSFSETVPPTRKRNAPLREPSPVTKRPRTSGSGVEEPTVSQPDSFAQQNAFIQDLDEEDLFGESPRDLNNTEDDPSAEDLHTIDLTEANEVPESLKKPEEDKRIKISTFQCVICMDDVTTLTVTHCGMPDLHMIFLLQHPSYSHSQLRSFILCTMLALISPRRSNKGQMSHVSVQNRHEASKHIHCQDQGLLAIRIEVNDYYEEGQAQGKPYDLMLDNPDTKTEDKDSSKPTKDPTYSLTYAA